MVSYYGNIHVYLNFNNEKTLNAIRKFVDITGLLRYFYMTRTLKLSSFRFNVFAQTLFKQITSNCLKKNQHNLIQFDTTYHVCYSKMFA